jgi:peptide subunit release factor 1 (eRF1)
MPKPAVIKTVETEQSVTDYINAIENETKRNDSQVILELMQKATKEAPKVWANGSIGFGNVLIESPTSGRKVEWFRMGFAPRKANITLYLTGNSKAYTEYLEKLGKHKTGGGCLYINKLADVPEGA